MATTRTFNNKGIAALNANTVIPPSPIPGVAYRNDTFNTAQNEVGETFELIPNSANFNEQQFIITSFIKMLGEQGIVGWSDLTDYIVPAIVWASDGNFYTALQASGPGGVGARDPISQPLFWEETMNGAAPMNYIQDIIENVGIVFVQDQFDQFMDALTRIAGGSIVYIDTGAANVYDLTLNNGFTDNDIKAYFNGLMVKFFAINANTGASTAQIGALGGLDIKDIYGQALVGGEIAPGFITTLIHNGVDWTLVRDASAPVVTAGIDGGGPTLVRGFNAASVARRGPVGEYTLTFSNALPSTGGYMSYGIIKDIGPDACVLYTGNISATTIDIDVVERGATMKVLTDCAFDIVIIPAFR